MDIHHIPPEVPTGCGPQPDPLSPAPLWRCYRNDQMAYDDECKTGTKPVATTKQCDAFRACEEFSWVDMLKCPQAPQLTPF